MGRDALDTVDGATTDDEFRRNCAIPIAWHTLPSAWIPRVVAIGRTASVQVPPAPGNVFHIMDYSQGPSADQSRVSPPKGTMSDKGEHAKQVARRRTILVRFGAESDDFVPWRSLRIRAASRNGRDGSVQLRDRLSLGLEDIKCRTG
jgi:hypothetical protein